MDVCDEHRETGADPAGVAVPGPWDGDWDPFDPWDGDWDPFDPWDGDWDPFDPCEGVVMDANSRGICWEEVVFEASED